MPFLDRRRQPVPAPLRLAGKGVGCLALAMVSATCDATSALRPPEVRDIALAWEGDTLLVAGGTADPAVTVTIDGEPHPLARIRYSSADPSIVGVAADGRTLEGHRIGTVAVTARLLDATLPLPGPALVQTVVVSPHGLALAALPDTIRSIGDTVRLAASATDAAGAPMAGVPLAWSSTDTAIAVVDGAGLVTGRRNGSTSITAKVGAAQVTAPVVVRQRAAGMVLSTRDLVLDALGADSLLAADVVDARGTSLGALAPAITWATSAASIATVAAGRVAAVAPGTTWLRVDAGPARDSIPVTVAQRATRVVVETPTPVSMRSIGETAVLRARAYDRRDNEITVALPSWRSLDPLVVHVESRTGIATGLGAGSATLVAELDGASALALVEVADVPARLLVEPEVATMTSVGDTLLLRWSARNARGVEIASASVGFGSTDTAIVRALPGGRVVAAGVGTARVIAFTDAGVADTAVITVVNAVAHVAIGVDEATLASVGDSVVPPVAIRNARSAELPRTAVVWSSDDPGVARVTAGGIVVATGAGETMVRATSPDFPDRRDSMSVAVTNAPAAVVIERDTDILTSVGASRGYSAEVRNARDALLGVAPAWRSADAGIARVSTTGLVTAVSPGVARIIAAAGAVADTLLVTVRDDVASLELTPAAAALTSLGDLVRPTVTARNALGGIVASPAVAWQSTDSTVARVQADVSILAVSPGTTRIVAAAGSLADTMIVTVTNDPVLIDIAGAIDTIPAIGDSLALAVVARNARGDVLMNPALVWSVSDPVVARVGANGIVTARGVGATWVRASGGTAADSTLIEVTNEPGSITMTLASSGVAATVDTMTASGQALQYTASVRNLIGLPIAGAAIAWRSTDPAVVQVSPTGTATAVGLGTAFVVAQAGTAEDSVRIVIVDPRRIYVDNSIVMASRFGTRARPYATIQAGIDAAGVDDTVIVARGTSYSETVTLGRRVTLLGDSAAYVSGGRNPLLLPMLRHDLGAAGITTATPGASYTIRYLAIQHSVDGEAIAVRDADNLVLEEIHVNPAPGFRTGRGILVERATGSALISRSRVDSVYAFGVRLVDVADGRINTLTVRGVGARAGHTGAGIDVLRGSVAVTGAVVRRTAGPQVLLSRTAAASLAGSTLTGEQQLVRLDSAGGTTTISGNTFDLRRQAGESAPARGGGLPDPSGLEVLGSPGVLVEANTFIDVGGQSSLMDAVRLADVRVAATGAPYGALLNRNQFRGGRAAVRSARSTWSMTASRVDSASYGVLLGEADTVALVRDTVVNARTVAVQSTGAAALLSMIESSVAGAQRAVVVTDADRATLRHNTISGTTFTGVAQPASGAIDLLATEAEVVRNTVSNVRGWSAIVLRAGAARLDSNVVTRNLTGVRLAAASVPTLVDNAIFDNDTLPASARRRPVGLVSEGAARVIGANWWGAPEGPRTTDPLTAGARGDSVTGLVTAGVLAQPPAILAGSGAAAGIRKIVGDTTVAIGLPVPMTARVVDAQGRPLPGASVTFRVARANGTFIGAVRSGNENLVTIVTDVHGFATTQYVAEFIGSAVVTASTGSFTITFTATTP